MKFSWLLLWTLVAGSVLSLSGCGGGGAGVTIPTPTPNPSSVVRVACVGDSITEGFDLSDASTQAYPAVLGRLLGNGYQVGNFGLSGTTLLNSGGFPYQQQAIFTRAKDFNPDILIVFLGSNDTDNTFDATLRANFVRDSKALISAFREVNPNVKVYVCLPILARPYDGTPDAVLVNDIYPLIRQVSAEASAPLVDLHDVLSDTSDLYADPDHPNAQGQTLIARQLYRSLTGKEPPAGAS